MIRSDFLEAMMRVKESAEKGDNEVAHGEEDELHESVLKAIANGELDFAEAKEAAKFALETRNLKFSRWYA